MKIAEPHFDADAFDPRRFRASVDRTLADLGAETLDVVQWLLRHTPNDDAPRIAILDACGDALQHAWSELAAQGKVRALGIFPYGDAFLRRALALPNVDGVVSYYNESERELAPFFDEFTASGRSVLGIRPLRAGAVRGADDVSRAIAFALAPKAVAGTIVGLSTEAQIAAAVAAAS